MVNCGCLGLHESVPRIDGQSQGSARAEDLNLLWGIVNNSLNVVGILNSTAGLKSDPELLASMLHHGETQDQA